MSNAAGSTPPPTDTIAHKRKRSRSASPNDADGIPPTSRRRSHSPPQKPRIELQRVSDVDPVRRAERERQLAARVAAMELEKTEKPKDKQSDAQAEFAKLVGSRSGGVYMPPARLRALQQAASGDKASPEYQRLSWDALRKSITGIVNRVNIANIKQIVPELFSENLIRGRGLLSRSIMKAQAASLPFTPVFAAVVAILNTKLPQVGELLLTRLISQFRRSFKRNDKIVCHSTTTFIAHLVNQSVANEIIALQILVLLLERPTDDSIEIAVGFMREVGAFLAENSSKANATVYERFRAVLNEGNISQRVQYMIEVLMQVRKDKYKDNPILPEGLDLVEEEEQITHEIQLEQDLQVQEGLNIFKVDPDYLENEEKYKRIKAEILGENSDEESGSEEEDSDEDENEVVESKEGIEDRTETNLVNLRRIIYLTIMNALNYEEAVHKLLKVQLQEGQEIELANMIIECCSQERSYSTFYGLVGERFCKLNRVWTDCFEEAFGNYYSTVHRYETNRLRNIARFFGHIMATDSISWAVFHCVKINEDDTTSSSRIFIKILMNEMMESMGLKGLSERFKDEEVKRCCSGMFPMDNPKNTRFAINYFTSIGLGIVTEEMRDYLKNAPRLIMEQRRAMLEASSSSDSSSDSDSSDSDSSDSTSDSDSSEDSRRDSRRRKYRSLSSRGRGREESKSPPPRRSRLRSRSPPPPIRYRDSETIKGSDRGRERDYRRQSPPHRPNGNGRDRRRDHSSPSSSPPPTRSRHMARPLSRSRSPPPHRLRDAHRSRSPPSHRLRDAHRSRSPLPPKDARRSRSPLPHKDARRPPGGSRERGESRNGNRDRERARSPPPHMRYDGDRDRPRDNPRDKMRISESRDRDRYGDRRW